MRMKKLIAQVASAAVAALCLTACSGGVNITQLDMDEMTINTGESAQAAVQYLSDKEVDTEKLAEAVAALNLTYTMADESIATVDADGVVTGVKAGETELTVQTEDGKLTVTAKVIVESPLEGVEAPESLELAINGEDSQKLDVKLVPEDATNVVITFASSDESVATVDEEGNVKAVGNGECVITTKAAVIQAETAAEPEAESAASESVASTSAESVPESTPAESASESIPSEPPTGDGNEKLNLGVEYTAETRVIVKTSATGITLSSEGGKLYVGNSANVQVYTSPVEADAAVAADVKYTSSDESVATVAGTTEGAAGFTIKGVGVGSATITVEYNGLTATYTVSVSKYVAPQQSTSVGSTGGSSSAGGSTSTGWSTGGSTGDSSGGSAGGSTGDSGQQTVTGPGAGVGTSNDTMFGPSDPVIAPDEVIVERP